MTMKLHPGMVLRHHSGRVYTVLSVSKGLPDTPVRYIGANGRPWERPLDEFEGKFTILYDGTNLALAMPYHSTFQERVEPWLMECFGPMIAGDREERNHRFLEEALELVQSAGCTASEAHQLVDYVYGRPVGEIKQEAGGAMVTLAALCLAHGIDMHGCAEDELTRIWTKVEQIRAKQAAKPKHSPLPK